MSELSGLKSIQPLVKEIAAAMASFFDTAVQIVDHTGIVIGESGCGEEKAELPEKSGELQRTAISLNDTFLGEIRMAPGHSMKVSGPGAEQVLRHLSSLLAAQLAAVQAERKVRDLTAVLEAIEEGILIVNGSGAVDYANAAGARLLGLDRQDLPGKPMARIWPNLKALKNFPKERESISGEEIYRRGDRWVHFIVTARPLETGPGGGRVLTFWDPAEARYLTDPAAGTVLRYTFADIIGRSEIIRQVKERAMRAAAGNSTVLITGESGTGKGVFARAIHSASPRARGPFVSVNCGAIPENLLESELFGYEKGAFTGAAKEGKAGKFELADKGTIFLDEIGEMPPHLQVKLLHVLQNREVERVGGTSKVPVDIRIIAASNRDLDKMMQERKFRKDLYFRLGVIPLHIPPLRERKEDILLFVENCLKNYAQKLNRAPCTISPEVKELFLKYHWPGNVRELENAIEYAMNMCSGSIINREHLPPRIYGEAEAEIGGESTLKLLLQDYERRIFEQYLQRFGDSSNAKNEIAQALGISRATLYRKLAELGLNRLPADSASQS
ncbi:MAG TPA: sigma 54-interacting transcriptional regulator [Bacillota bacterium]|nr:sigma 54-interacting transcriptional regulator [Bacillota bacterium]HOA35754.1 sigma 54-interacting transcriptional regulator [Bacillota bacterium]HPZ11822.1 sigma 54-interacting transcriptional regulator [Bacillota bacterium]HQE09590.1 sigma 54-interacting transcriptional regulator [Bacillota bacterium]